MGLRDWFRGKATDGAGPAPGTSPATPEEERHSHATHATSHDAAGGSHEPAAVPKRGRRWGRKGRLREIRADYRRLDPEQWTEDEWSHFWSTCTDEEYWAEWERWSRITYDHPNIKRVKRSVIDLAREAAAASDPLEFAALLRVEKGTITELALLPGTVQGNAHAIFQLGMKPVDRTLNGTVHSHPDEHPYPSDADFELFEHEGAIHLILCRPYGPDDWRAYDHTGLPTHLDVVP